jgi:hypothetical protein
MKTYFPKIFIASLFFTFLFFIAKTSQSQTCDPECCSKPNGYIYNKYLDEFCDPNYKGGRWIIIEGVCQNGQESQQRGCATCDTCTPGVPRTSPPNLEKNECTPGGCQDVTPSPKEEIIVPENQLFITNKGRDVIRLNSLIIADNQRLVISSDLNKSQVFPFDYSSYCNFFQNQLRSLLDIYLGYFANDSRVENIIKAQTRCGGNAVVSIE